MLRVQITVASSCCQEQSNSCNASSGDGRTDATAQSTKMVWILMSTRKMGCRTEGFLPCRASDRAQKIRHLTQISNDFVWEIASRVAGNIEGREHGGRLLKEQKTFASPRTGSRNVVGSRLSGFRSIRGDNFSGERKR